MNNPYMMEAINEAKKAFELGEVPVGAVIVCDGKIISRAHNLRETSSQAIAHAEILAIQEACSILGSWRLDDCDLYVTLEPCPMCAGAIINARIKSVYYGAYDPKGGACGSVVDLFKKGSFNHSPVLYAGIMEEECESLLKSFFESLRRLSE
ncbi:MAG TPA: nucleoside deaminase [Clostridiaceae bacterium]|nr:nucleoside deaminase [Clostridiaceae bacterium]